MEEEEEEEEDESHSNTSRALAVSRHQTEARANLLAVQQGLDLEALPQLAVSESEELPPVDALVCDALAVLAQPDLLEPVADLTQVSSQLSRLHRGSW